MEQAEIDQKFARKIEQIKNNEQPVAIVARQLFDLGMEQQKLDVSLRKAEKEAKGAQKKPYALITLPNLLGKTFDHKEDMQTAMQNLDSKGIGYVPFYYSEQAESYYQPEVCK